MREERLKEGTDFTYNEKGQMVLSAAFLKKRGYCCKSGCQNCPYEEGQGINPNIPIELQELPNDDYLKYIEMADEE